MVMGNACKVFLCCILRVSFKQHCLFSGATESVSATVALWNKLASSLIKCNEGETIKFSYFLMTANNSSFLLI